MQEFLIFLQGIGIFGFVAAIGRLYFLLKPIVNMYKQKIIAEAKRDMTLNSLNENIENISSEVKSISSQIVKLQVKQQICSEQIKQIQKKLDKDN